MKNFLFVFLLASLAAVTGFAKDKQNVVTAKTAVEFVKAINDDTTIQVPLGTELNLSTVLNSAPEILEFLGIKEYNEDLYSFYDRNELLQCPKGVYRREVFKGYELVVVGYRNLTIICTNGEEVPMILVDCSYANVLTFSNCANLTIDNFVIGHNVEPGFCTGAVLNFCACYNVKVTNCQLFGSGTYGITGDWVEGLDVSRTRIYDCTYGITEINHSSNVTFDMCLMDHNEEFGLININTTDNATVISRSIIAENKGTLFTSPGITLMGCVVKHDGELGRYGNESYGDIPTLTVGYNTDESYYNDHPDWYFDAFYGMLDGDFSGLYPKDNKSEDKSLKQASLEAYLAPMPSPEIMKGLLRTLPKDAFGSGVMETTVDDRLRIFDELATETYFLPNSTHFFCHKEIPQGEEGNYYLWSDLELYKMDTGNNGDDTYFCTIVTYGQNWCGDAEEAMLKDSYVYHPGGELVKDEIGWPGVDESKVVNKEELRRLDSNFLKEMEMQWPGFKCLPFRYDRLYLGDGQEAQPLNVLKVYLACDYYNPSADEEFISKIYDCMKAYFVWNGRQFEYAPDFKE